MPEYLAPGVYIEEQAGPRTIEGVSTSTVGFVGQTERGPNTPRLVTSWLGFTRAYGGLIGTDVSYLPYAVKGFFDNGGRRAYIARVTGAGAVSAALPADGARNLDVAAIGPGIWGNGLFVRIDPGRRSGTRLTVLYYRRLPAAPFQGDPLDPGNRLDPRPDASEVYDNLSTAPTSADFVLTTVNGSSTLVTVSLPAGAGAPRATPYTALTGGTAGGAAGLAQYQGDAADVSARTGLAALDLIDDVSILCTPDEHRIANLREDVRTRCELSRYRFAIQQVDPARGDVGTLVNALGTYPSSDYVALYYPWLHVLNPDTEEVVLVPPCGHVAGVYARTDNDRGVHKAPANEDLRGILGREIGGSGPLEFTIGKGEHDQLNPAGVDVLRDFRHAGRGVRVWGARTRSPESEWKYVNVRRLFIFLEKSIDTGTQWVVFEPNDESTWAAVVRTVTGFLLTVWRDGALVGATQDEAFFVRCDRTTMTEDDILNGRLICYIGVAPVRPAEFVIFRIGQKTLEAQQ